MTEFLALVPALSDWFGADLANLPADVRARVERDFPFPGSWDGLGPGHRRGVAEQWDTEHDPANEEAGQIGWDEEQAGWAYWRKVPVLTTQDFCILRHGYDPREFKRDRDSTPGDEGRTLGERVADDVRILSRAPTRSARKSLPDWIALAQRLTLDVPAYMHPTPPVAPTARVASVAPVSDGFSIRCMGTGCELTYAGVPISCRATTGLRYIALLANVPGKPIAASDLDLIVNPPHPDALSRARHNTTYSDDDDYSRPASEAQVTLIDPQARLAYEREVEKLKGSIELAKAAGNTTRVKMLELKIVEIFDCLRPALNHRGRLRQALSADDKKKKRVGAAIRRAIETVTKQSRPLGDFLRASIKIGGDCWYRPAQ